MDIKDFIKDSLLQIVDGISESNEALKAKGASIPTKNIAGEGGYWYAKPVSKDGDIIRYLKVDYDIAVEFVLKRTGTSSIGFSASLAGGSDFRVYPSSAMSGSYTVIEPAYVKVNSIQCSRAAQTLTPSGTLNYIAVGR